MGAATGQIPMTALTGLILAGGKSTRMGRDKALVDFRGRALIAHAIERLGPQVARLAISWNGDPGALAAFGYPILPDASACHPGPLAGVVAGLKFARENNHRGIVTVPCDAPFAPRDLAALLIGGTDDIHPAVAIGPRGVEPLFAYWPLARLADIEIALAAGHESVWKLLEHLSAQRVDIPVMPGEDWTLNLNSPDDLSAANARTP